MTIAGLCFRTHKESYTSEFRAVKVTCTRLKPDKIAACEGCGHKIPPKAQELSAVGW